MRPILLDMNGFASFREPTQVDFTDADFFALVGPTGSGKSTVIDAMTFALYGSVPRWGRKGMVSLALAPTMARANRQARLRSRGPALRRGPRTAPGMGSQVSQRAASLERLADRHGLAGRGSRPRSWPRTCRESPTPSSGLLGLSYEDFCQCVVLPQGQFANFLHAKPGERQEILLRLLGAEHYRQMMMQANQRASAAAQRAEARSPRPCWPSLTPRRRPRTRPGPLRLTLGRLSERVEAARPQLQAADSELAAAGSELARLEAERTALAAVRVPGDVAALDEDLAAGRSALEQARTAEKLAEDADRVAREALADGPQRAPLERARERRTERGERLARLPSLEAEAARLSARSGQAEKTVHDASASLEKLRGQRDADARSAEAADRRVADLSAEHAVLAAVISPGRNGPARRAPPGRRGYGTGSLGRPAAGRAGRQRGPGRPQFRGAAGSAGAGAARPSRPG